MEPEELDEIAPGRSQTIDITDFVDLEEIEPVYFDRTYYLAPRGKEYTKVYELLRAASADRSVSDRRQGPGPTGGGRGLAKAVDDGLAVRGR